MSWKRYEPSNKFIDILGKFQSFPNTCQAIESCCNIALQNGTEDGNEKLLPVHLEARDSMEK